MPWAIFAGLAAFAAAVLLWGFLRRPRALAARVEHDLEVYRAQLDELERERDSGLISEAETEAAKIEIQRRALAADQARDGAAAARPAGRDAVSATVVAVAVPLAAFGLYMVLGNPQVPSVPFAERPAPPAASRQAQGEAGQANLPDVDTMLARLRERLAENPDDRRGWTMLASSLASLGQFDEAIEAFDRAISLTPEDAGLYSAKAEAMIMAAQGQITPGARAALENSLRREPKEPRARYYLAVAKHQGGDGQGAFDDLKALLAEAPPDAPWYTVVRDNAVELAGELGLDPDTVLPKARAQTAAPATDPSAEAAQLAAGLERDPKDFRGWIALARARTDLGDRAGARAALDRGTEVYQGAPFVLQQFQQAAAELGLDGESAARASRGPDREDLEAAAQMTPDQQMEMIRGMVGGLAERLESEPGDLRGWQMLARSYGVLGERSKAVEAYRHVLTLDGADTDALFFLGEAAQDKGDTAGARDYWTRLLAALPPGSAEHTMVRERLNGLKSTN